MEIDETKLGELLASPLADETVVHLKRVLDDGMEVRVTSSDKPTMTIRSKFYLEKLLANHFKWKIGLQETASSH